MAPPLEELEGSKNQSAVADSAPSSLMPLEEDFGPVEETDDILHCLDTFILSRKEAKKAGYILSPLTAQEIEGKWRCKRCRKALPKTYWNEDTRKARIKSRDQQQYKPIKETIPNLAVVQRSAARVSKDDSQCVYHSGEVHGQNWTCCRGNLFSRPCEIDDNHEAQQHWPGQFEKSWLFHPTPKVALMASTTLERLQISPKYKVVVIDCEMGVAKSGESVLISLSAVDFFTRAVLINKLVFPDIPMAHYNTRFSGVTRRDMERAKAEKSCIFGRHAARAAMWQLLDQDSIVVGHGANGDLSSLRWLHDKICDTLVNETKIKATMEEQELLEADVASNSKPFSHPGLSLKTLANARLGRRIQNGRRGHDSLEDALATRDLLLWHVRRKLERSKLDLVEES